MRPVCVFYLTLNSEAQSCVIHYSRPSCGESAKDVGQRMLVYTSPLCPKLSNYIAESLKYRKVWIFERDYWKTRMYSNCSDGQLYVGNAGLASR